MTKMLVKIKSKKFLQQLSNKIKTSYRTNSSQQLIFQLLEKLLINLI